MLLLGTAYHGLLQRSDGAPAEPGRVLSTATDPPFPTEHWVLEDKDIRACSAGRRGAAEEECLAAVREAASRDGQEVAGFKSVNDGAAGVVPAGCSYSLHTKTAMFNANAAGGSGVGSYRLACLAPPDDAPISAAPVLLTVTGRINARFRSGRPSNNLTEVCRASPRDTPRTPRVSSPSLSRRICLHACRWACSFVSLTALRSTSVHGRPASRTATSHGRANDSWLSAGGKASRSCLVACPRRLLTRSSANGPTGRLSR